MILETIHGDITIKEACTRLGIGESRFHEVRSLAMQAACEALEPRPRGRQPQLQDAKDLEIAELEARLDQMRVELETARIQTEIALVMPHLLKSKGGGSKNEPSGGLAPQNAQKERARRLMRRSSQRFFDRVNRLLGIRSRRVGGHRLRGFERQKEVRHGELLVKRDVIAFARCWMRRGKTLGEVAHQLSIPLRTVQQWWSRWRSERLRPRARGRGLAPLPPELKEEIQGFIEIVGPDIGVGVLRGQFPGTPRNALAHILAIHRFNLLDKERAVIQRVHWNDPGAAWAMDFAFPPSLVEGWFGAILVVRDLASKRILAATPVRSADQGATVDLLAALFEEHGAPLVIKTDNGSHFTGEEVADLLQRHRILHLRSPARYPQFNGSVEAGIGALRTWAHHRAAAAGHPGRWTLDDIFGACLTINEFGRPHGDGSPTPNELWRDRDAEARL